MPWIYLALIIITTGFGLWGLIARGKWLEKQSKKIKK